jgi:signal transduction histidine kinase
MKNSIYIPMLCTLAIISFTTSSRSLDSKIGDVDIRKKELDAKQLISKAADFLMQKNVHISEACHAFQRDPEWRVGEMAIFVFDANGICYLYGDNSDRIWKNFSSITTISDEPLIKTMLEVGRIGGWVNYEWNNALQRAFVKVVNEEDKTYIIGTGFYPDSAADAAQQLTSMVQAYLIENGLEKTALYMNDPEGVFVKGNVTTFLISFEGNIIAHSENRGFVGENAMNWKDSDGKYMMRNIIKIAKRSEHQGWTEYQWNNATKRVYVRQVIDPKTKKYYAAVAGYYPDITQESVISFVKKAINYIKANGEDSAIHAFNNAVGEFVKGDMRIYVYDLKGTVIADGYTPALVGQNLINSRDAKGKYWVKSIIDLTTRLNKTWEVDYYRNSYQFSYCEKVETPDGKFIVCSGYFPWSKNESARTLTAEGLEYLRTHTLEEAMRSFTNGSSEFLRGDLNITVYGSKGFTWAHTQDTYRIWEDMAIIKDDKGKSIFDRFRSVAEGGGGWIEYEHNNTIRRQYVRSIEKKTLGSEKVVETFYISSGYYL